MTEIFLVAGESSGDLHGAHLAKALSGTLYGVAGPAMRDAGVEPLFRMEELQLMGFIDVLVALPRVAKLFKEVRESILSRNPSAVVLIDFGGFNVRLAKSLRKHGYTGKIIQFISPKVWAWGAKRIETIAANMDAVLVIYPFEVDCYKSTGIRAEYIGNPLVEAVEGHTYTQEFDGPLLGIFPGSRTSEIRRNLPRQLAAAEILRKRHPELKVAVSIANETVAPLIPDGLDVPAYDLMRSCTVALATSGTVTVELALHNVPTVCVYRPGWINAAIAGLILRINLPHYCMVNIALGREIFPELIHTKFTPQRAADLLDSLLTNSENCLDGCRELQEQLAQTFPSQRGAAIIEELIFG